MPRPKTSLQELQHIAVKVSNIEESLRFYTEILGFTLTERHEPGDHPTLAAGLCFLRCTAFHHDLNLVYHTGEQPALAQLKTDDQGPIKDLGLHHFAFRVKDRVEFLAWRKWIEECGVKIVRGPLVHSPTHPEGDGTWGENRPCTFATPMATGSKFSATWPGWTRPTASRRNGMRIDSERRESTPPHIRPSAPIRQEFPHAEPPPEICFPMSETP